MWEPQPLTTLRASKACRGENFTFFIVFSSALAQRRIATYVKLCNLGHTEIKVILMLNEAPHHEDVMSQ
jgi:hypothetical protein